MKRVTVIALLAVAVTANAHQPVMDMAPRWADGFGFQVRQERYGSDDRVQDDSSAPNPLGLERFVDTTWLEGVYTFHRAVRITAKIPYIDQHRTVAINGSAVRQHSAGLGDVILGLPLKRYNNKGAMTENWGLTPSVRLPTGSNDGDLAISDGSVDIGLSLSYSRETPGFYQLYDLFVWQEGKGSRGMRTGNSWGFDANFGPHPWHDNDENTGLFTLWDITVRHNDAANTANRTTATGGDRVQTGPVLVYYRDGFMARAEYKFLAYERIDGTSTSRGDEFSLAFGFAF